MQRRTVLDFHAPFDIWPIVDAWAGEHGYRVVEPGSYSRLYQKGHGFWVAPMKLLLAQQGPQVHLEVWIAPNLIARAGALFLLPAEMGIQSGGFTGSLPRKMMRNAVNQLLARLNHPPII